MHPSTPETIAEQGRRALDRARVAFEEADIYAPGRAARERQRQEREHVNSLIREAKGGNPRKLVSERDLHAVAFARLDRRAR